MAEKPRYRANDDGSFTPISGAPPAISVSDLAPRNVNAGPATISTTEYGVFDGDKFSGGFGPTQLQFVDYWTLRKRSAQIFNENLYGRGLIRRLITNEINTGLSPEFVPDETVLGITEDEANDWSETAESRFNLWAKNPDLCDWEKSRTFGAIQRVARQEALVAGDVLVVLRQNPRTKLPSVQLVSGECVRTPIGGDEVVRRGHTIRHGVEFDSQNRVSAYWIEQKDGLGSRRLPAFGEKSGRRLAWLVYGTDRRLDDVRGQPLLSLVLQSLKEIDRYRDSAQRKAVVNSILAMFIKKTADKPSTLPFSNGAVRKDTTTVTDGDGTSRQFQIDKSIPGVVMEELQTGEEPVGFHSQGTDINFGVFEEAIIQSIAWANEVPPEVLRLAFSNNYSASQAAINEFKIYINKVWSEWGETFCTPISVEWTLAETLQDKLSTPGLLAAWRDPSQYDTFTAWTLAEWYGSIKPTTDMLKTSKGSEILVANGWSTNARESRVLTGTKYQSNMKRQKREIEQKIQTLTPWFDFLQGYGIQPADPGASPVGMEAVAEEFLKVVEGGRDAD